MNELHKSSKFDQRIMFTFMVENFQRNNIIEIHKSTLLHNTIERSQKGVVRWTSAGCALPKTN